ncbi:SDR family oxidoreductase [Fusobacterium sp. MFO224]|uniref:SDR family oxidoreductase n=1 Tax=Fusobacterium sp. MFO224 TaxID=3378070 RepID=UPI00385339AF
MKKLVVITGASSGFGREMAYLFNKAGYPLLLIGRRIEIMEGYNLSNTLVKKVDVTNYDQLKNAIEEAEGRYGKTDLLVNNAGIMLLGNITKQNPLEWQNMLNVNVMGVLNGMKIVLGGMTKRNEGTIINISSIAGIKSFPNHAAYCASKYGVSALSETVREEVANTNVRIMTVEPGAAETELLSHTTDEEIKDGYNKWKETMVGKSMDPAHVAKSVKFMYEMPQEVNIRELVIAPTKQDA